MLTSLAQKVALAQKVHKLKFLVSDHSTTILTGVGVSGTVATAYLSGRASFKAAQVLEDEKQFQINRLKIKQMQTPDIPIVEEVEIGKRDKVKLVWKLYIPAVGVGATTIVCIVTANRISSKKIAALAVASGISERALQEYKDKVFEKFGPTKERDVYDEIAQDRVTNNPVSTREVILAGTGEVLCYDMTSGRYFQSTVEEIKRAENKVNYNLINFMSASLTDFYDEIGLPATTHSESVGWNLNNRLEVKFSTTMSTDGRPCIAIDFIHPPILDYDRTAWDG